MADIAASVLAKLKNKAKNTYRRRKGHFLM